MREKRMGDIGMLKMGVLACLLWGKGKIVGGVVGDVVVLRSCVCLGSYVCLGVYRERRRGKKQVNTNHTSATRCMLCYDAVQGCLKMHLSHYGYFRIIAGFIYPVCAQFICRIRVRS